MAKRWVAGRGLGQAWSMGEAEARRKLSSKELSELALRRQAAVRKGVATKRRKRELASRLLAAGKHRAEEARQKEVERGRQALGSSPLAPTPAFSSIPDESDAIFGRELDPPGDRLWRLWQQHQDHSDSSEPRTHFECRFCCPETPSQLLRDLERVGRRAAWEVSKAEKAGRDRMREGATGLPPQLEVSAPLVEDKDLRPRYGPSPWPAALEAAHKTHSRDLPRASCSICVLEPGYAERAAEARVRLAKGEPLPYDDQEFWDREKEGVDELQREHGLKGCLDPMAKTDAYAAAYGMSAVRRAGLRAAAGMATASSWAVGGGGPREGEMPAPVPTLGGIKRTNMFDKDSQVGVGAKFGSAFVKGYQEGASLTPTPTLTTALSQLEKALEELSAEIGALQLRLDPVLRGGWAEEDQKLPFPEQVLAPGTSQVIVALAARVRQVQQTTQRIYAIYEALQL